jgi:hypothetical protein
MPQEVNMLLNRMQELSYSSENCRFKQSCYQEAKSEAISAKAEWILKLFDLGETVEGHSVYTVIESLAEDGKLQQVVTTTYLEHCSNRTNSAVESIIDTELNRLANLIAPDLLQAQLDDGVDYD